MNASVGGGGFLVDDLGMHASLDPSLAFHRAVQRVEATHVRIRGHYRYADRAALDAALDKLREQLGAELADTLARHCRIDTRTLMFDLTVPMSSDPGHGSV